MLALVLAVPATALAATTVKAPKSGSQYAGPAPYDVVIQISGRSVQIAAFNFPCGEVSGRSSINDFRLKRTDKGYRFHADVKAITTYSDEQGDENVSVKFSGRFSTDAKTVRGHLRVKSKRCGDTGDLKWRAKRRSSAG